MENRKSKFLIKNTKQMFAVIAVFTLLLFVVGTTYAFFNYTRTGSSNELVVGNIYFNHIQENTIHLSNTFPEKKESARLRSDNVINFQVTGYNESYRDIYYKLLLSHGDDEEGIRIDDDLLRFDLTEVMDDNTERYLLYNEKFLTINNTILTKNRVDAYTSASDSVTHNYKLRMWIDSDVAISDTYDESESDENGTTNDWVNGRKVYTTEEWNRVYASVKVTVIGEMQNVYYYNSFNNAVTALNAENYISETDRSGAKVGIYVDAADNSTNMVFYDNCLIDKNYIITKPVDINLYRYTLNYKAMSNITNMYIRFDNRGIIENGDISTIGQYETRSYNNIIFSNSSGGAIKNINIKGDSPFDKLMFRINVNNSNVVFENSNFSEYGRYGLFTKSQNNSNLLIKNLYYYGTINVENNGNIELNDSEIYFANPNYFDDVQLVTTIGTTGKMTINNSSIIADSQGCYHGDSGFYNCTCGISNSGQLIINSGYVYGNHSAISTGLGSRTYVYGGTFESEGHGGFYFTHGPSGVAYVENANINGVSYSAQSIMRPTDPTITVDGVTYTLDDIRSAFYIGGETDQNGENVYLVNCNISSVSNQSFVMRQSTPEQSLYMSGCTFNNTSTSHYLRIDSQDTMRIYLGNNNNFGNMDNVQLNKSSSRVSLVQAKNQGVIIETNVDYKNIVSPQ